MNVRRLVQDDHKGTGRTHGLLTMMVDAIQDGQPIAIMVSANHGHRDYALTMTMEIISRRSIDAPMAIRKSEFRLSVDNSFIYFITINDYERFMCSRIPCDFIDHAAWDAMTNQQREYAIYLGSKKPRKVTDYLYREKP